MRDDGPTSFPAGSRGKVLVMTRRARLGLPLFHPCDARRLRRDGSDGDAWGVYFDPRSGLFVARPFLPRGRVRLGLFDDLEEALLAVRLAVEGKLGEAKALAGR